MAGHGGPLEHLGWVPRAEGADEIAVELGRAPGQAAFGRGLRAVLG